MTKYIDAGKLIAEIERQIEETKSMKPSFDQFWAGRISAFKGAIKIAESLQQEQPKVDLVAELEHHLATTPKEQLEKEWKELEHWNNVGPTVQEFLYGKQPEVDLKMKDELGVIKLWFDTIRNYAVTKRNANRILLSDTRMLEIIALSAKDASEYIELLLKEV